MVSDSGRTATVPTSFTVSQESFALEFDSSLDVNLDLPATARTGTIQTFNISYTLFGRPADAGALLDVASSNSRWRLPDRRLSSSTT